MEQQKEFVQALKNLREKVVDRAVFGAEEAIELVDLLLVGVTGKTGEPPAPPIVPPPDSTETV